MCCEKAKFKVGDLVVYENYWIKQVRHITGVKPNIPSGCPSLYDRVPFKYVLEGLQSYPGYYETELRRATSEDKPRRRNEKTLEWEELGTHLAEECH